MRAATITWSRRRRRWYYPAVRGHRPSVLSARRVPLAQLPLPMAGGPRHVVGVRDGDPDPRLVRARPHGIGPPAHALRLAAAARHAGRADVRRRRRPPRRPRRAVRDPRRLRRPRRHRDAARGVRAPGAPPRPRAVGGGRPPAPERPGDAQHADRRHRAARPLHRRAQPVARDAGLGARGRRPRGLRALRRARDRPGVRGGRGLLRRRPRPDVRRPARALGRRVRGRAGAGAGVGAAGNRRARLALARAGRWPAVHLDDAAAPRPDVARVPHQPVRVSAVGGLLPFLARNVYGVGERGLGFLVASFSLGALIGSVVMVVSGGSRRPERFMVLNTLAWYALLLGLGFTRTLALGALVLGVAGLVQSLAM